MRLRETEGPKGRKDREKCLLIDSTPREMASRESERGPLYGSVFAPLSMPWVC